MLYLALIVEPPAAGRRACRSWCCSSRPTRCSRGRCSPLAAPLCAPGRRRGVPRLPRARRRRPRPDPRLPSAGLRATWRRALADRRGRRRRGRGAARGRADAVRARPRRWSRCRSSPCSRVLAVAVGPARPRRDRRGAARARCATWSGRALYLGLRRWYLTAVSLVALVVQAGVFAAAPAHRARRSPHPPLLFFAWTNSRFTLRPVLDLDDGSSPP